MLPSRDATSLLLLILSLFVLTACDRRLDIGEVESQLERGVAERIDGLDVEVDCPDEIEAKQGENFECIATADDGSRARIRVVQQDDDGNVRWEITDLLDEGG